jgi:predicted transcriptional regulator
MTGTASIKEINGSSVTLTLITQQRLCSMDSATPGESNPCVVPSSGYYYSFWKTTVLFVSGDFTRVQNIRVFSSSGAIKTAWQLGTNGMVVIAVRDSGDNGLPVNVTYHGSNQYAQSTGTIGTTGNSIADATNGHPYYKGQTTKVVDFDSKVAASPLTVDSTQYSSATTPEFYSKAWVIQAVLATNAVQGDKPNELVVVRYDEW